MKQHKLLIITVVLIVLVLTGCIKKQTVKSNNMDLNNTDSNTGVVSDILDSDEPSIRGKKFEVAPDFHIVYFDFDSISLNKLTQEKLDEAAEWLLDNNCEVLVEGHCDDKGSTEYNLGLGQRRARAVRKYLVNVGIGANRIATLSFGEEKPLSSIDTENRRSEIKVRYIPIRQQ